MDRPPVASVGTGGAPTVGVPRWGVAGHGARDVPEPCSHLQRVRVLLNIHGYIHVSRAKDTDSDMHSLKSPLAYCPITKPCHRQKHTVAM